MSGLIKKNIGSLVVPLNSSKITLRELILQNTNLINSTGNDPDNLSIVTLKRNGQTFRMIEDHVLDPNTPEITVVNDDQIEIKGLPYKPGQVFALSGAGNAQIIINI